MAAAAALPLECLDQIRAAWVRQIKVSAVIEHIGDEEDERDWDYSVLFVVELEGVFRAEFPCDGATGAPLADWEALLAAAAGPGEEYVHLCGVELRGGRVVFSTEDAAGEIGVEPHLCLQALRAVVEHRRTHR